MKMHTTPLDREILTHIYVSGTPFPRDSQGIRTRIKHFAHLGLLTIDVDGLIIPNFDALKVYMDALGAVPLPVPASSWVIPR